MGIFRLFLSLVVVRNHMASFSLMDGMMNSIMSVQSFFIVSGFYTSMILKTKYSCHASFDFAEKNKNRL